MNVTWWVLLIWFACNGPNCASGEPEIIGIYASERACFQAYERVDVEAMQRRDAEFDYFECIEWRL